MAVRSQSLRLSAVVLAPGRRLFTRRLSSWGNGSSTSGRGGQAEMVPAGGVGSRAPGHAKADQRPRPLPSGARRALSSVSTGSD